jgi:Flp pilus assembly protein CpaB
MQLVQKVMSSRRGTLALGGVAALLAALILIAYLNQYRSSVAADSNPVTVLVAKKLIEKGMPGDIVGLKGLFDSEEAPKSQVQDGAITDPAALRGRVAVEDIYPGQQLTVAAFGATTQAIGAKLAGKNRAIALPLDSAHGMIGDVESGDRVDVFASVRVRSTAGQDRPLLKVIAQNALVLDAPADTAAGAGANQTANVVLRVNRNQAAEMAFTVDNGKIWLVLRPRAGSRPTRPGVVTNESLIGGINPARVYNQVRKSIVRKSIGGRP